MFTYCVWFVLASKTLQGAGETLRGTLNSTVDRTFHTSNYDLAAEKNQAALEAGRYEIENRRLYHPANPRDGDTSSQDLAPPIPNAQDNRRMSSNGSERGPSRLASWVSKAAGRLPSRVDEEEEPAPTPRPTAKLRKRNSSSSGIPTIT